MLMTEIWFKCSSEGIHGHRNNKTRDGKGGRDDGSTCDDIPDHV